MYYANYEANNGTTMMQPITDTNLKNIISDIREIAGDNRQAGHIARWEVSDEEGRTVAAGYIDRAGRCHRETV